MTFSSLLTTSLIALLFSGCIENKTNKKASPTTQLSASQSTSAVVLGAIGSNTGEALPRKAVNTDTTIEFKRSNNINKVCTYPSGKCRTNDDEYSGGASLYGDVAGAGKSFIHYMKFKLYSNGYFSKNPDGHFAFGMRGQFFSYEKYKEKAGHDGKGIILGAIGFGYAPNKNNPTCVTRMLQAESWFRAYANKNNSPNANNIFPSTCSDTILEDYKWYSVEIEVTSHHYIIYKVFNSDGTLIYKNYYNDLPNLKEEGLTTWFIGHVFESKNVEWSLRLENFEVGHIAKGDPLYPVKDYAPAYYLSYNDKKITRENGSDYSIVINKNMPANIKVHNVLNRQRLWGCANFRATKYGDDNIDCNNWQNYREMKLKEEVDWSLKEDKFVLRSDYLKSIPNQFYTVYFRQNPQDELSQISMSFELVGNAPKSGTFCDSNRKTVTSWMCDGTPPDNSWVDVGSGCFHKASSTKCNP